MMLVALERGDAQCPTEAPTDEAACPIEKDWNGKTFSLVTFDDTQVQAQACKTGCVYKDMETGKKVCFKTGGPMESGNCKLKVDGSLTAGVCAIDFVIHALADASKTVAEEPETFNYCKKAIGYQVEKPAKRVYGVAGSDEMLIAADASEYYKLKTKASGSSDYEYESFTLGAPLSGYDISDAAITWIRLTDDPVPLIVGGMKTVGNVYDGKFKFVDGTLKNVNDGASSGATNLQLPASNTMKCACNIFDGTVNYILVVAADADGTTNRRVDIYTVTTDGVYSNEKSLLPANPNAPGTGEFTGKIYRPTCTGKYKATSNGNNIAWEYLVGNGEEITRIYSTDGSAWTVETLAKLPSLNGGKYAINIVLDWYDDGSGEELYIQYFTFGGTDDSSIAVPSKEVHYMKYGVDGTGAKWQKLGRELTKPAVNPMVAIVKGG